MPSYAPITTTSLFGRLVGAHHIEDAALSVLRIWLPTYLNEVARQSKETPGSIALPRSMRVSSETDKMPEDQTPAIVLSSPGTTDVPSVNGARQYMTQFVLDLSAVVSARGGMEQAGTPRALRLARLYALAIAACLVQKADDDGYLFRRDLIGYEFDVLPSIDDRTICVGKVRFSIEVPDVLTNDAGPVGPMEPEIDPLPNSPEWPIAVMADAEIQKVPLSEPETHS